MKLLVITTMGLFPRKTSPMAGIFFAHLLRCLRPLVEQLIVVVPTTYIPKALLGLARFATHRNIGAREHWLGLEVLRPRFLSVHSESRMWVQARSFCHAALPLCRALHRRRRFDLVVGYGFDLPAHTAQLVARTLGLRSVCWAIGEDVNIIPRRSAENRRFFRHCVRNVDLILTESDALRRTMSCEAPQARHIHPFYKGIDLRPLEPSGDRSFLRKRLQLAPDLTYMLMCGRLLKDKGAVEFCETFRALSADLPDLGALWVGDGPMASEMKKRTAADGLSDRLLITGKVLRGKVLEYMQAADILVFPSYHEGLPNVVMEALACGLPTVATDVGGVREVLADGKTGLLVPPKDANALTQAAARLLKDSETARRMARRGRQLIVDHFDVAKNAPVALEIFNHVAAGGSADDPLPACANKAPGQLPL